MLFQTKSAVSFINFVLGSQIRSTLCLWVEELPDDYTLESTNPKSENAPKQEGALVKFVAQQEMQEKKNIREPEIKPNAEPIKKPVETYKAPKVSVNTDSTPKTPEETYKPYTTPENVYEAPTIPEETFKDTENPEEVSKPPKKTETLIREKDVVYDFKTKIIKDIKALDDKVFALEINFSKKNYMAFMKDLDDLIQKLKNFKRNHSEKLSRDDLQAVTILIAIFQKISDNPKEFFTREGVDSSEKKKRAKIIDKNHNSGENDLLLNILVYGGITLVVLLALILLVLVIKSR